MFGSGITFLFPCYDDILGGSVKLADTGYLIHFGPVHFTTAEVMCIVISFIIGLLIGIHMAVPRYARRGD